MCVIYMLKYIVKKISKYKHFKKKNNLFFAVPVVQSMWYPPITKQPNLTFELPSCLCLEVSMVCAQTNHIT